MEAIVDNLKIKGWLIEQLPYEMVWIDYDGNFVYANAKFCEAVGYTREECTSLSVSDLNVTVTPKSWRDHWEEVNEKGSIRFMATHKSKKGKFYVVEVHAQKFFYHGIQYICATINEMVESSFYKNLIDNTQTIANLGGWELNLHDGSILATTNAMQILNVKNLEDLSPPKVIHKFKNGERLRNLLGQVIRNGLTFDEVLETKEPTTRYIRAGAKAILKGDKIYKILGFYQDVTEIKKKDLELELYKTIIDKAQDLVYVYNDKGDLLYFSESVIDTLGYSAKELCQMNMFDLDASVSPEFHEAHFKKLRLNGSHKFEFLLSRKNGTKFPVDITASHLKYCGKDYSCAVVRDITVKKKRDKELHEALEEIKTLKDRLENENVYLQEEIGNKINYKNIISGSKAYNRVLLEVDRVAPTDTTVMISGESGTGKELLARALHGNSPRKDRPLIKINCATLPKELFESELFGHKKGAFTGAFENKMGKFTLADGGTIFLDEIGELPLELQPKLLRVLQEGEYDELGGTKTITTDVRIIAATNRDLKEMVQEGRFRKDLYYRLNVFPIHNIPLRARKDDIPLLAQYFLEKYAAKAGKSIKTISKDTVEALMNYSFPGNIRELENLIERAVILEKGTVLKPGKWIPNTDTIARKKGLMSFETAQRECIIEALNHTNWRVSGPSGAARILKMHDKTLFATMKRLGIEKKVGLKSESSLVS